MTRVFYMRQNKISHLKFTDYDEDYNNYKKCGYLIKLFVPDEDLTDPNDILYALEDHGFENVRFVNDNAPNLILFSKCNGSNDIDSLPLHYKKCFCDVLHNFYSILKRFISENLENFFDTSNCDIEELRKHTDEIDLLKLVFINSYSKCLNMFPEIESNRFIMSNFGFFSDTWKVNDIFIRYIKSFIFGSGESIAKLFKYYTTSSKIYKKLVDDVFPCNELPLLTHKWLKDCNISDYLKMYRVNTKQIYNNNFIVKYGVVKKRYELKKSKRINIINFINGDDKTMRKNIKRLDKDGGIVVYLVYEKVKFCSSFSESSGILTKDGVSWFYEYKPTNEKTLKIWLKDEVFEYKNVKFDKIKNKYDVYYKL